MSTGTHVCYPLPSYAGMCLGFNQFNFLMLAGNRNIVSCFNFIECPEETK